MRGSDINGAVRAVRPASWTEKKKIKEKSTPLGVITGASVPSSSPRLLPLELSSWTAMVP